jgi:ferrochelatase
VKIRHFFDHPGYVAAHADGLRAGLAALPPGLATGARLVFTAHSIPQRMNDESGPAHEGLYARQQYETARLVAESVRGPGAAFDLVWQSRSGPPTVAWLEPDILAHLQALADQEVRAVVVAPTGFVSDHVEVKWDLDVEARQVAEQRGMAFARAATAGTHPAFVRAVRELVQERLHGVEPAASGTLGVCGAECPVDCCPAPRRAG